MTQPNSPISPPVSEETEEQIAARHRNATWSTHVLEVMRFVRQFPELTPEQLHEMWLVELEDFGIDPNQSAAPVRETLPQGIRGLIATARTCKEQGRLDPHPMYAAVRYLADRLESAPPSDTQ